MGKPPDWPAIRGQRTSHGWSFACALALVFGMLLLNALAFRGMGYLLYVPLIGWMVLSGYRYRVLSRVLRHAPADGRGAA
jgi:hypothetical protein